MSRKGFLRHRRKPTSPNLEGERMELVFWPLLAALVLPPGLLFLYSWASGWRRLAQRYQLRGPVPAGTYHVDTLVLGELGLYTPPASVDVGPEGITLRPVLPFRLFFRPVQLPGAEIVSAEIKMLPFFEILRLKVGKDQPLAVGFPPSKAVRAIQKRLRLPIVDVP
jgi:hypothetical protein